MPNLPVFMLIKSVPAYNFPIKIICIIELYLTATIVAVMAALGSNMALLGSYMVVLGSNPVALGSNSCNFVHVSQKFSSV